MIADYIEKVQATLDAGAALVGAIDAEQARHRDGVIMIDSGRVAAAIEALRDAQRQLEEANLLVDK